MAHTQDFVPSRDAEFDGWLSNLTNFVDGKTTTGAWASLCAKASGETKLIGIPEYRIL